MLTRMLGRFRRDRKGLAAVEFALILPVMVTLFFGIVELSMAVGARSAVTNMASVAADLTAQESSMTPQDMSNVFSASSAILYPYTTSPLNITVYSIVDDGKQGAAGKVDWSCSWNGSTGKATTGPSSPPSGSTGGAMIAATNLDSNGNPQYGGSGSVILATISYNYASPTTKIITGGIAMNNSFYLKPRRVSQITKPSACS